MLVHEALEAAGATGTNLQQVLDALKTCDFAAEMPADAAYTNFDVSRHLVHLSPRLQGYIIAEASCRPRCISDLQLHCCAFGKFAGGSQPLWPHAPFLPGSAPQRL